MVRSPQDLIAAVGSIHTVHTHLDSVHAAGCQVRVHVAVQAGRVAGQADAAAGGRGGRGRSKTTAPQRTHTPSKTVQNRQHPGFCAPCPYSPSAYLSTGCSQDREGSTERVPGVGVGFTSSGCKPGGQRGAAQVKAQREGWWRKDTGTGYACSAAQTARAVEGGGGWTRTPTTEHTAAPPRHTLYLAMSGSASPTPPQNPGSACQQYTQVRPCCRFRAATTDPRSSPSLCKAQHSAAVRGEAGGGRGHADDER